MTNMVGKEEENIKRGEKSRRNEGNICVGGMKEMYDGNEGNV